MDSLNAVIKIVNFMKSRWYNYLMIIKGGRKDKMGIKGGRKDKKVKNPCPRLSCFHILVLNYF